MGTNLGGSTGYCRCNRLLQAALLVGCIMYATLVANDHLHRTLRTVLERMQRLEDVVAEQQVTIARLQADNHCSDPSGPQLVVDGKCSCTGDLLVGNRSITAELALLHDAQVQCGDIVLDPLDVAAGTNYSGTRCVTNGDYIDASLVACAPNYHVTNHPIRWNCSEGGGAARSTETLCELNLCTPDPMLDSTVYSGPPRVANGDPVENITCRLLGTNYTRYDKWTGNAIWICPSHGAVAKPSSHMCTNWTLLLENAAYGGKWYSSYTRLAPGRFYSFRVVWRSGYVSGHEASASAAQGKVYPWQAMGTEDHGRSFCTKDVTFSFDFHFNGQFVAEQPDWCTETRCLGPVPPHGDVFCAVDFEISHDDVRRLLLLVSDCIALGT